MQTRGMKYKYIGELSTSPYQRAREHYREIINGKKTHPLVIHFKEVHNGMEQEVLFRTIMHARTALERQVWESVHIDRLSHNPQQCHNLKTEWGL